jgi:cyclic pyranopterin phosphate synthase
MEGLSHLDKNGRVRMVDVAAKEITPRSAVAAGAVTMSSNALALLRAGEIAKGSVLTVAKTAGILAAKRTAELIPLCHPLQLDHIDVTLELTDKGVAITSHVKLQARTGAEMEALTAVAVAALTVYDMCKAVDKQMVLGDIRLVEKTGGKSGAFRRSEQSSRQGGE